MRQCIVFDKHIKRQTTSDPFTVFFFFNTRYLIKLLSNIWFFQLGGGACSTLDFYLFIYLSTLTCVNSVTSVVTRTGRTLLTWTLKPCMIWWKYTSHNNIFFLLNMVIKSLNVVSGNWTGRLPSSVKLQYTEIPPELKVEYAAISLTI